MSKVKLDKDDVKHIKIMCQTTTLLDREIAGIFGVSRKHINAIRNGKRWSDNYGKEKETIQEDFERFIEERGVGIHGEY